MRSPDVRSGLSAETVARVVAERAAGASVRQPGQVDVVRPRRQGGAKRLSGLNDNGRDASALDVVAHDPSPIRELY